MSWIRRRARDAEPPGERLPDLEFLALVKASLEELAPGVTRGATLKGNSLASPRGWVVGVLPPRHGGPGHYDLIAMPDVSIQPDVPCFIDCAVAMSGNPAHAAAAWAQTAGACLLELMDRRGHFADHSAPGGERGVPGWHSITSGATAFGVDAGENQRMQAALLDANVVPRIAGTFAGDLESPFFNGVKVFYGGQPGAMTAEVRINGERHEAASAAMAALGLPEPAAFTAVRYYALLLPAPADGGEPRYPGTRLELDHGDAARAHAHSATCGCGEPLDPEHPGFALPLPHLIAQLSAAERARVVRVDTGAIMVATGIGNFLKVRLPVQLDDGRTVIYLVWSYLQATVIKDFEDRVHSNRLAGHRFEGLLGNGIEPWGEELLQAPIVMDCQQADEDGSIPIPTVIRSGHPLLSTVLERRWPAELVLGDRDPRLPDRRG